jgi:crotonobetainyl-CoA:carnitine CoA-transferase CaiB-like acyl-CoA transferase
VTRAFSTATGSPATPLTGRRACGHALCHGILAALFRRERPLTGRRACGHALCHGILAALFRRERTGRGEVVQLSLYDVALHLQTGPLTVEEHEIPGCVSGWPTPWIYPSSQVRTRQRLAAMR